MPNPINGELSLTYISNKSFIVLKDTNQVTIALKNEKMSSLY